MQYYRENPGDYYGAAKACVVDRATAKRLWGGPPSLRWPKWMKVVYDLFAEEKAELERAEHERRKAAALAIADEQEKARKLKEELARVDEGIMRLARSDILGALGGLSRLSTGVNKLAERLGAELERGHDAQGNPLNIDIQGAMKVLVRYAQSTRSLVEAARIVSDIERVRQNLPTTIVGVDVSHVTLADASREHEAATRALNRARALGIVVEASETPSRPGAPYGKGHGLQVARPAVLSGISSVPR